MYGVYVGIHFPQSYSPGILSIQSSNSFPNDNFKRQASFCKTEIRAKHPGKCIFSKVLQYIVEIYGLYVIILFYFILNLETDSLNKT